MGEGGRWKPSTTRSMHATLRFMEGDGDPPYTNPTS
jgi:hypothetical protein